MCMRVWILYVYHALNVSYMSMSYSLILNCMGKKPNLAIVCVNIIWPPQTHINGCLNLANLAYFQEQTRDPPWSIQLVFWTPYYFLRMYPCRYFKKWHEALYTVENEHGLYILFTCSILHITYKLIGIGGDEDNVPFDKTKFQIPG